MPKRSTVHWLAVALTLLGLGALVVVLAVLRLWTLALGMAGLTAGLGFLVAAQIRDRRDRPATLHRRTGLVLLLVTAIAVFVVVLM